MWLNFLDKFFNIFHILLIFFNLFGWIYRPFRKLNFITVSLTVFSWFILGIFFGIGYCPLTDWHYQIKNSLGQTNLPQSYIKYLLDSFTPFNFNPKTVEIATFGGLIFSVLGSLISNFRDYKKGLLSKGLP